MAKEIERKFLLKNDAWRLDAQGGPLTGSELRQGYLCRRKDCVVRVRQDGQRAFLTIKGPTQGLSRSEYEYEIPLAEGLAMLEGLAEKPLIEKTRYKIMHQGMLWEIDEFSGVNQGLTLAELELESEEQDFARPDWLGNEVSHDPRYLNANLVERPFSTWPDEKP